MWIALNNSFLSVVAHFDNVDMLLVRARNPAHITAVFPDAKVYVRERSDYGWRADVSREAVAKAIADRITGIDYTNFKDSVKERDLHDCYLDFWHVMYSYQHRVTLALKRIATPKGKSKSVTVK